MNCYTTATNKRKNIYCDANTNICKFNVWNYSIEETKQIEFTNILARSATVMKMFSTEQQTQIDEIIEF
jgi:hypothetical protein